MTEPRRWLEPESSVSPEVRRLLEVVDKPQPMRPDELIRAAEKVEMIAKGSLPPQPTALLRPLFATSPKVIAVVLAALAAGGAPHVAKFFSDSSIKTNNLPMTAEVERPSPTTYGSSSAAQPSPEISSVLPEAPAPVPSASYSPVEMLPPNPRPKPPVPGRTARETPSLPKASSVEPSPPGADAVRSPMSEPGASATSAKSSILPELQLAEQARGLVASNPAAAIRLLDRMALEFPGGVTWFSREQIYIKALRQLGREAEATAREQALDGRNHGKAKEEPALPMQESAP